MQYIRCSGLCVCRNSLAGDPFVGELSRPLISTETSPTATLLFKFGGQAEVTCSSQQADRFWATVSFTQSILTSSHPIDASHSTLFWSRESFPMMFLLWVKLWQLLFSSLLTIARHSVWPLLSAENRCLFSLLRIYSCSTDSWSPTEENPLQPFASSFLFKQLLAKMCSRPLLTVKPSSENENCDAIPRCLQSYGETQIFKVLFSP